MRHMKLAARVRDDSGAVSILAVLFIGFALFVVLALTAEVGHLYVARRQAQSAADAGALAAADSLPVSDAAAITAGEGYVTKNLPTATKTVTLRYNGDPNKVKVEVRLAVTPFFTLFPSEAVGAHAVASRVLVSPRTAVYASNTVIADGTAKVNVAGEVYSGGTVDIASGTGSFQATDLSYVTVSHSVTAGVDPPTLISAGVPPRAPNYTKGFPTGFPITYGNSVALSDAAIRAAAAAAGEPILFDHPTEDFTYANLKRYKPTADPRNLRGLIVCDNMTADTEFRGTVTVIAYDKVHLDSYPCYLTAWNLSSTFGEGNSPLFYIPYAYIRSKMASSYTGVIFAPNGRCEFGGSGSSTSSNLFIEAKDVKFLASSTFTLTGIGPVTGSRSRGKLVE